MAFKPKIEKLILGITNLIEKNRSSLSVDQQILLENTIVTLEEMKSINDSSIRKKLFSSVLLNIMLATSRMKIGEIICKFLEDVINEN